MDQQGNIYILLAIVAIFAVVLMSKKKKD